jgi:hypothetical protein
MAEPIITVSEYKTLRNITDSDRDASLALAAEGATDAILQFTDRDFTTAAAPATKTYTWNGGNVIEIDDVVSVSAVVLDGQPLQENRDYILGPTTGVAQAFYWIDLYNDIVESPLMGFSRNEDVLARAGILDRRTRRRDRLVQVEVTGSFGFPSPLPASLRVAAAWLMDIIAPVVAGDTTGHQAEAIADLSYVNASEEDKGIEPVLPPRVVSLLEPFRRLSV